MAENEGRIRMEVSFMVPDGVDPADAMLGVIEAMMDALERGQAQRVTITVIGD